MGKTPFLDYESPALTIELRAQTEGNAACFFLTQNLLSILPTIGLLLRPIEGGRQADLALLGDQQPHRGQSHHESLRSATRAPNFLVLCKLSKERLPPCRPAAPRGRRLSKT